MAGDFDFMKRALACAARGEGHTRPNPPVGAVIVKAGRIIGEGWHRRCGEDHAEVAALKDAMRRAGKLRPGTSIENALSAVPHGFFAKAAVYVTLEPCSRPGRVGACCDALIAAGVAKVVWAVPDPNPKNRGRAARRLRGAGIQCECWQGRIARADDAKRECVAAAQSLIAPFAKHVTTGLPYVTVKLAMSLDGRICDASGDSKWMSSVAARRATGLYRERVDVVMVGAETVRRDNPSLLSHGRRNDDLWRAVVSRSGKLPHDAQVFTDAARDRTLVYRDAAEAIADLGRRGFLHVFCEGGLGLARSLVDAGLVDQWISVLCPMALGSRQLSNALKLERRGDATYGHDLLSMYAAPSIFRCKGRSRATS